MGQNSIAANLETLRYLISERDEKSDTGGGAVFGLYTI